MDTLSPRQINRVRISLQPGQRALLAPDSRGHLFVVSTGLALLEARIGGQRRVLEILTPREVFPTPYAPALDDLALVAAASTCLMRYCPASLEAVVAEPRTLGIDIEAALAHRSARRTLHMISIAEPKADGRLADFLVEIGLAIGRNTPAGRAIDLPLSREQIASYLALNSDTLSRLFTRMKARGVITVARRRVVVPDWEALCRLAPLGAAHRELAERWAPQTASSAPINGTGLEAASRAAAR